MGNQGQREALTLIWSSFKPTCPHQLSVASEQVCGWSVA